MQSLQNAVQVSRIISCYPRKVLKPTLGTVFSNEYIKLIDAILGSSRLPSTSTKGQQVQGARPVRVTMIIVLVFAERRFMASSVLLQMNLWQLATSSSTSFRPGNGRAVTKSSFEIISRLISNI